MTEWIGYVLACIMISLSAWGIIKEIKCNPSANLKKEEITQAIVEETNVERKTDLISPWNVLPKNTVFSPTKNKSQNSDNHSASKKDSRVNLNNVIPNNVNLHTFANNEKLKLQDTILQIRKELELLKTELHQSPRKIVKYDTNKKTASMKKNSKDKTGAKKHITKKSNVQGPR